MQGKKAKELKNMATLNVHSPVFSACSVLMSLLFAYSASVQLDDPGKQISPSFLSFYFY